jgi:hypothetical protein
MKVKRIVGCGKTELVTYTGKKIDTCFALASASDAKTGGFSFYGM